MATRKNLAHSQEVRERIQTSQLINRLNGQAFDTHEMSDKAIQAAKILLAKSLPDLKAIEHSGEVGGIVSVSITHT